MTLLLLACSGCGTSTPLANAQESPEALAAAVLDALATSDRARLESLAVSEREFRDHVWPELPAARPERNLPFSFVWGDLHQKSDSWLSRTLEGHGGKRYTIRRVVFRSDTRYERYVVHRGSTFHVVNDSGEERQITVCGSMLEKDGGWKVFSYVVDD